MAGLAGVAAALSTAGFAHPASGVLAATVAVPAAASADDDDPPPAPEDSIVFAIERVAATDQTATTYHLTDTVITLGESSPGVASISVTMPASIAIDETPATFPTSLTLSGKSALATTRSYNYKASTKDASTSKVRPLTAAEAATALEALSFVSNNGGRDAGTITVSFSADSVISWEDEGGYRHFYQTITFKSDGLTNSYHSWFTAYNQALSHQFHGLNGYLASVTSAAEDQVMAVFIKGSNAWAGGARARIRCFGTDENPAPTKGSEPAGYDAFYTGPGLADSPGFTKIGFDCAGNATQHPIPDVSVESERNWADTATAYKVYQLLYDLGETGSANGQLLSTFGAAKNWYWVGGPVVETGRPMRGSVFYRLPRSTAYNATYVAGDYTTLAGVIGSETANTCGEVAGGWCKTDPGKVPGVAADGSDAVYTNWNRGQEPNNAGAGEPMLTFGHSTSSSWNDLIAYNPNTTNTQSYTVEFSEGWAEEGGGTYTPPASEYTAVLPTAVHLVHVKEGTTVALAPSTAAPSSGLSGGAFTGGAEIGGLDLPGYTFSRAYPTSLTYDPAEVQTVTYYYTKNPVTETLKFDIDGEFRSIGNGEGIVYTLDNVQVPADYGPIRAVSVSYPSTLDMTGDDSAIEGFVMSKSEGNGVRTWTYMAGDSEMTQLTMGLDYAHVGVTPERFQEALEVLTFSPLVPGIETPGTIQVTMADFAGTAGTVVEDAEPIPQPVWTYALRQGGSIANASSYLLDPVGSVGEMGTSRVSASPEKAPQVIDWNYLGFSVDGETMRKDGGETIAYGSTRHTLAYYYTPTAGYTATFNMGENHSEEANPFPGGVQVAANGKLARPPDPHDPGYQFLNWYVDSQPESPDEEVNVSLFDFNQEWTGVHTIYAWWKAEDPVEVTFDDGTSEDPDCGSVGGEPEEAEDDENSCEPDDSGGMVPGTMPNNAEVPYDSLFEILNGLTPMREGHEFAGWYAGDDRVCAVHEVEAGTAGCTVVGRIDANVTMTAHWSERDQRVVQFAANTPPASSGFVAETLPASELVPFAGLASDPAAGEDYAEPVAYGYRFIGWSASASGDAGPFDFEQTRLIAPKTTLYAQWERMDPVDVTFDVNAPSGTVAVSGTVPASLIDVDYSQTIPDTISEPIIEGYKFSGWYDAASDGNRYELGANGTRLTRDVTLHATWTQVSQTLTVTFEPNTPTSTEVVSGTMPQTQEGIAYNATVQAGLNSPVILGYHFAGWVDGLGHTGLAVYPGETRLVWDTDIPTPPTQTWYATWELEALVAVTFDAHAPEGTSVLAGTMPVNLTNQIYNTLITPSTPLIEGYHFDGWRISSQDKTVDGQAFDPAVDRLTREKFTNPQVRTILLVAAWDLDNQDYTVTFDPNAGSDQTVFGVPDAKALYVSEVIGAPSSVIGRVGYEFGGWWYECDSQTVCTRQFNPTDRVPDPGQDVTLHAKWTENLNTYDVVYHANAGEDSTVRDTPVNNQDLRVSELTAAPESSIAREGYRFDGWYATCTSQTECEDLVALGTVRIADPGRNIDVYAKWVAENPVRIDFEANIPAHAEVTGMPQAVTGLAYDAVMPEALTPIALATDASGGYEFL
ncbi:MAG: InlB B-repeat-containing protein, partial [Bifidobacteriaceae bacterium]|nr:InlB B-repeat-containing protein [Bifidobacteriaceae bacterium]